MHVYICQNATFYEETINRQPNGGGGLPLCMCFPVHALVDDGVEASLGQLKVNPIWASFIILHISSGRRYHPIR